MNWHNTAITLNFPSRCADPSAVDTFKSVPADRYILKCRKKWVSSPFMNDCTSLTSILSSLLSSGWMLFQSPHASCGFTVYETSKGGCVGILQANFRYLILQVGWQPVHRAASQLRVVEFKPKGPKLQSKALSNHDFTRVVRDSGPLVQNKGRLTKSGGRDLRYSGSPLTHVSQPRHTTFGASPAAANKGLDWI